jgi:beta-phosphoglucomutase
MHTRASAVLFDLDGVLVTTDELHYHAWKSIAEELAIPFDRDTNHRLRGVSRMASLDIVLAKRAATLDHATKLALADRKNARFVASLDRLTPSAILPGVLAILRDLDTLHIPWAVASSSRNARLILERVGLLDRCRTIVDGNDITRSKPDPQVFLLAAAALAATPQQCVVVEDAESGVAAALAAHMPVLGVGDAARLAAAHRTVPTLEHITADELLTLARG